VFSLILTVISIALVVLLVIATIYYGGGVFMESSAKVTAQTVVNQSLQIAAARTLVTAQGKTLPAGAVVKLPDGYLTAMPVPPKAAYNSGEPSADDWEYYIPGTSGHFGVNAKLSQKTCMEINKAQGFVGIPAAWDGVNQVQCFGPTDTGYTYIYEPTGQTAAEHTAAVTKAVDDAKTVIPTATPGYPRLCPDNSTITTGVCNSDSVAAPVTAAAGFWVVQASVDYSPVVESLGYEAACPVGAIDPTGAGVNHPASKPGEPLAVDGDIVMEWELPPDHDSSFTAPLSRTWCIPANESDVLKVGPLSTGATSGYVDELVETITPPNPDVDTTYTSSTNDSVVLTANGVQWTVLATGFYTDTYFPSAGGYLYMNARKVAIGKVPTATFTYFVGSPSVDYEGHNYKVDSGTVMFDAAQPPCVDPYVAPGTGGAATDIQSSSYNTVMRKADGSVWVTGVGYEGLLSRCTYDDLNVWTFLTKDAQSINLESGSSLFIVKNDGSLWTSGDPDGQGLKLRKIVASGVKQAGTDAYLKTDGTLWYKGANMYNEFGDGTGNPVLVYTQMDSGVASMNSDNMNVFWIKTDKSLWVTGLASNNKLGATFPAGTSGYPDTGASPRKIADDVKLMRSMFNATLYVKTDGTVFASGYDQFGCGFFGEGINKDHSTYSQIGAIAGPVVDAQIDYYNIRLLGADGRLWAAGCDGGAFGNGSSSPSATFTQIASGVKMFAGGGDGTSGRTTLYLDQANVLHATGENGDGQFGNGTNVSTTTFGVVAY
jgi:phosphoribosyl-AMP cyclohydrolase